MTETPSPHNETNNPTPCVLVVLPAYNEAPCIANLLQSIHQTMTEHEQPYQVIVVDDGSTDNTAKIAESQAIDKPIQLVRHTKNQGLGATIRDGILHAVHQAHPQDIIVTMDADETHSPTLIPTMLAKIKAGADVVIASRYQPGARVVGVPTHRRFISYAASLVFRILFPTPPIKDYTCGFRAYKTTAFSNAIEKYGDTLFDQDGFQCMVDILLKLRRLQLIFAEVPMTLRYDEKQGVSKMNVTRTILQTLKLLIQRRLAK